MALKRPGHLSLLLLAWLFWPQAAAGQQATDVPEPVSCPRCAIRIESRTILGGEDDLDKFPGFPERIRQDAQGRYWLFSQSGPPALFDGSGRFLQLLGSRGQGPGEYQAPHDALFLADTFVVLDARQRRASVLSSARGYVRSTLMPSYMYRSVILSWPDSIVVADRVPWPKSVGWPLHLVSLAGSKPDDMGAVLHSFGPGDRQAEAGDIMGKNWLIADSKSGFWTTSTTRYELAQYSRSGLRLTWSLRRRLSWFEGTEGSIGVPAVRGRPARAPDPAIAAIEEDDEGLLWVYIHVPSPSWREAWSLIRTDARGEVQGRAIRYEKFYRTRIEVLDPRAGRVLARETLDGFFVVNAVGGRQLAVYSTDGGVRGETVTVLRFRLVRSGH